MEIKSLVRCRGEQANNNDVIISKKNLYSIGLYRFEKRFEFTYSM